MEDDIIRAMSIRFPYAFMEIKEVYDFCKSYDSTIKICEFATSVGLPLYHVLDFIKRIKNDTTFKIS